MIANVRVVEVLLKCLVVPSLMLNCLDHAAAQDGLRSYNRTLFFMMFRFVPLWISFWQVEIFCPCHSATQIKLIFRVAGSTPTVALCIFTYTATPSDPARGTTAESSMHSTRLFSWSRP